MIAKAVIEGFAWIIILAGCASILIETIARFIEGRRQGDTPWYEWYCQRCKRWHDGILDYCQHCQAATTFRIIGYDDKDGTRWAHLKCEKCGDERSIWPPLQVRKKGGKQ